MVIRFLFSALRRHWSEAKQPHLYRRCECSEATSALRYSLLAIHYKYCSYFAEIYYFYIEIKNTILWFINLPYFPMKQIILYV